MIKGIEAYTTHCCLSYPHGADIHHICTTMCRANFHFYTFASRHPLQPLTRPHFTTARHAAPAGGRFVHFTSHWADALSRFQSNLSGLGSCGALRRAWPHTWPAWYPARRTYWRIACFDGGMLHISLPFCVNKVCLALFSENSLLQVGEINRISIYLSICLSVCLSVCLCPTFTPCESYQGTGMFFTFQITQWAVQMSVCWRYRQCQQFLLGFSCILPWHRRQHDNPGHFLSRHHSS